MLSESRDANHHVVAKATVSLPGTKGTREGIEQLAEIDQGWAQGREQYGDTLAFSSHCHLIPAHCPSSLPFARPSWKPTSPGGRGGKISPTMLTPTLPSKRKAGKESESKQAMASPANMDRG